MRALRGRFIRGLLFSGLMFGLGLYGAGCDEGASDDDATPGDSTTGGEDTGGGGTGGDRAELEAPPGSVDPDELPDSDLENQPGNGGGTGAGTGGGTSPEGDQESPWGRPEADTGRPLPPRRPMNGSAQAAYRRGLQAAASGDSAQAQQAFQEALRADGNAYKAAYNLGVLADRAGQLRRVEDGDVRAVPGQPPRELNRLDSKNWHPTPSALQDQLSNAVRILAAQVDAMIVL